MGLHFTQIPLSSNYAKAAVIHVLPLAKDSTVVPMKPLQNPNSFPGLQCPVTRPLSTSPWKLFSHWLPCYSMFLLFRSRLGHHFLREVLPDHLKSPSSYSTTSSSFMSGILLLTHMLVCGLLPPSLECRFQESLHFNRPWSPLYPSLYCSTCHSVGFNKHPVNERRSTSCVAVEPQQGMVNDKILMLPKSQI